MPCLQQVITVASTHTQLYSTVWDCWMALRLGSWRIPTSVCKPGSAGTPSEMDNSIAALIIQY